MAGQRHANVAPAVQGCAPPAARWLRAKRTATHTCALTHQLYKCVSVEPAVTATLGSGQATNAVAFADAISPPESGCRSVMPAATV